VEEENSTDPEYSSTRGDHRGQNLPASGTQPRATSDYSSVNGEQPDPDEEFDRLMRRISAVLLNKLRTASLKEIIEVVSSVVIAAVALVGAVIAWQNYREIARNDAQTAPLVGYAKTQTESATKFSAAAGQISEHLGEAVGKLNIQAAQTSLLRKSAEDSAETAASTFAEYKRVERASLHVRDVEVAKIDPVNNDASSLSFFVDLENSGATSTKHLAIYLICGKHETFGNPLNFSKAMKSQVFPIPAVVGPHSNLKLFTCEAHNDYALSTPYFVFGRATYGDVFGVEHVTEYCWQAIGLPSRNNPSMQPCSYIGDAEHNCEDEDCKAD
jgi:hypothetical protein